MTNTIQFTAWGEQYEITSTAGGWSNPSTGAEYATPGEAMRAVLTDSILASGDDPEDEDVAAEIERYVTEALPSVRGMWMLKNKATGKIVDPRSTEFALSPADIADGATDWDEVLSADQETDIVDGFETVWCE